MRFLFVKYSPSQLLYTKIHLLLEIFKVDIYLHGSMSNYRCALLESLHGTEKDLYLCSNKQNNEANFANKVI